MAPNNFLEGSLPRLQPDQFLPVTQEQQQEDDVGNHDFQVPVTRDDQEQAAEQANDQLPLDSNQMYAQDFHNDNEESNSVPSAVSNETRENLIRRFRQRLGLIHGETRAAQANPRPSSSSSPPRLVPGGSSPLMLDFLVETLWDVSLPTDAADDIVAEAPMPDELANDDDDDLDDDERLPPEVANPTMEYLGDGSINSRHFLDED